jgi:hypothetical protein
VIKQKGDKSVEEWEHHRSGFSTQIYLRGTRFVATLLEREFEAPDISIIRKQLGDYAHHWLTMEWFPIIEIEVDGGGRYKSDDAKEQIEFKRERYQLSRSPAGEVFKVDWEITDPNHQKAQMQRQGTDRYDSWSDRLKIAGIPLGRPFKVSDDRYILDYTDDLWQQCENIAKAIFDLRKQLRAMISTNEGIQKFLSIGFSTASTIQIEDKKK